MQLQQEWAAAVWGMPAVPQKSRLPQQEALGKGQASILLGRPGCSACREAPTASSPRDLLAWVVSPLRVPGPQYSPVGALPTLQSSRGAAVCFHGPRTGQQGPHSLRSPLSARVDPSPALSSLPGWPQPLRGLGSRIGAALGGALSHSSQSPRTVTLGSMAQYGTASFTSPGVPTRRHQMTAAGTAGRGPCRAGTDAASWGEGACLRLSRWLSAVSHRML